MLTILDVFWLGFWIFWDVLLIILNPTWFSGNISGNINIPINFNSWRDVLIWLLCRLLFSFGSFCLLCLLSIFWDVLLVILNPTWFPGNFNSWRGTLFFMLCRLLFNVGSFCLLCRFFPSLTPTQHNPNPANAGPGPSGDN